MYYSSEPSIAHPLDRFLELDYTVTKRLPTLNVTFRTTVDDICPTSPFSALTAPFLLWSNRAWKSIRGVSDNPDDFGIVRRKRAQMPKVLLDVFRQQQY